MDINFKKRAIAIILAFTMAAGTIYSSPLTSKEQTVASAKPGNKYKVNSYGILMQKFLLLMQGFLTWLKLIHSL